MRILGDASPMRIFAGRLRCSDVGLDVVAMIGRGGDNKEAGR